MGSQAGGETPPLPKRFAPRMNLFEILEISSIIGIIGIILIKHD